VTTASKLCGQNFESRSGALMFTLMDSDTTMVPTFEKGLVTSHEGSDTVHEPRKTWKGWREAKAQLMSQVERAQTHRRVMGEGRLASKPDSS